MDRSRLEAFSDGVFAVPSTLLALGLTVPEHAHLVDQLHGHWPAFLAYLLSFFMIGIVWVNHHVLVRAITTVDRTLLFLNLVLLLFVVLIPFATATEANYFPGNNWDAQIAMVLYAGVFLGMSAGFGAIFEWTLHGQRVVPAAAAGEALGGAGRGSSAAGWSMWSPSWSRCSTPSPRSCWSRRSPSTTSSSARPPRRAGRTPLATTGSSPDRDGT